METFSKNLLEVRGLRIRGFQLLLHELQERCAWTFEKKRNVKQTAKTCTLVFTLIYAIRYILHFTKDSLDSQRFIEAEPIIIETQMIGFGQLNKAYLITHVYNIFIETTDEQGSDWYSFPQIKKGYLDKDMIRKSHQTGS